MCEVAKAAFLAGVHRDSDQYAVALYEHGIGPDTEAYTTRGEVSGAGYTAGGQLLKGWKAATKDGAAGIKADDAQWPVCTVKAAGALVYNASHADKPAVLVLGFGESVVSTNGPFTVRMPEWLLRFR